MYNCLKTRSTINYNVIHSFIIILSVTIIIIIIIFYVSSLLIVVQEFINRKHNPILFFYRLLKSLQENIQFIFPYNVYIIIKLYL